MDDLDGGEEKPLCEVTTECGVTLTLPADTLSLKIMRYPKDAILREPAVPIDFDKDPVESIHDYVSEMLFRMYAMRGIGLAANQVGIRDAIFVMDTQFISGEPPRPGVYLNPEILELMGEPIESEEGCLSCGDVMARISRFPELRLKYTDLTGEEREVYMEGLSAVCVQHEMEHLQGRLILDHLSRLKLDMAKRKGKKMRKKLDRIQQQASR